MRLIQAEWIKLKSTASFWWTSGIIIVYAIAMGIVLGMLGRSFEATPIFPLEFVGPGISALTLTVIAIQAVMVITTEYRYNIPSIGYVAEPRRWRVPVAKLVLYGVIAPVLTLVSIVLAIVVGQVSSGVMDFSVFGEEMTLRLLWAYPMASMLIVLFVQGLALIIRQTAGTVIVVLVWMLFLEDGLSFIPKVGWHIAQWAPFRHLNAFITDYPQADLGVPFEAAPLYFLLWALGLWIVGVVLLEKRDV